jgi:hypothetical protein
MDKATSHLASDASDQSIVRTLQAQVQMQAWKPAKSVDLATETAELESRAWKATSAPGDRHFLGRRHYDFISPPDENKE